MSPSFSPLTRWLGPSAAAALTVASLPACMPSDPEPGVPTEPAPRAVEAPLIEGELSPERAMLTFARPVYRGPSVERLLPPEARPAEIGVSILPTLSALCGIPTVHVYFETDQDAVPDVDIAELERVATCLTTPPLDDVRIAIIGHTDPTGDADYNAALSRRRATAVSTALIEAGVGKDRIELDFRGEANIDTGEPDARPLMRRVDVRVVETDPVAIRTEWFDLDGDRKVDVAEFPSYVATLVDFPSWDPDGDSVISAAELARGLFGIWDIDATGVLDHVEFGEGAQRWYPTNETLPLFLDYDRDGDGLLTPGEFVAAAVTRQLDTRWDLDGDARLDPAELAAALGQLWDADDDGVIDREELADFAAAYWRR